MSRGGTARKTIGQTAVERDKVMTRPQLALKPGLPVSSSPRPFITSSVPDRTDVDQAVDGPCCPTLSLLDTVQWIAVFIFAAHSCSGCEIRPVER